MAKIVIDAGHGLHTGGKRCLKKLDPNQTREWVLNDRIADEVCRLLKLAGHTVKRVDDTDGSTDVALGTRVKKANEWGADLYASIHHNAGISGGSGGGTEVYVSKGCSAKSKKVQEAVYKHAIKRGKLKGDRADGTRSANFYVIAYTKMPAFLIECGFMDSKTDIKYILDKAWSKKIARGIAEGICEVYGGKINAVTAAKKDPDAFKVKVICDSLNIREAAGTNHKKVGAITDKGKYTIIATKKVDGVTWGKLKSGAGWISLHSDYVKRV